MFVLDFRNNETSNTQRMDGLVLRLSNMIAQAVQLVNNLDEYNVRSDKLVSVEAQRIVLRLQ